MSYLFNLPNITATTPEGKLTQMQSFLYQTVEQLNWALNALETVGGTGGTYTRTTSGSGNAGNAGSSGDATSNFNEIKALIIKSADIINAYYEKISARLSGLYVAQSDFGTYTEETDAKILANSKAITQHYTDIQKIDADVAEVENTLNEVNAHIKTGLLYYAEDGTPVYGLEIGQRTKIDDVEVFNKYARFTSDKLSFYDSNGTEVAYISDKKLYIMHIEVIGSYTIGGLVDTVLADGSVVTR